MAGDQVTMSVLERKRAIESALNAFATQPLYQAGMGLLDSLGYRSDRALRVSGLREFRETLDQQGRLRDEAAKTSEWVGVEFLRQITSEDVSSSAQGTIPFQKQYMPSEMQSYVFVAVELKCDSYTQKDLSEITRAVNRVFDMPAMLLFKYGEGLTLAVIRRRPNKRDNTRDVPDIVTLVKDITYVDPLRAHIEILHDLSLDALYEDFYFHNFTGLHQAWENRLNSDALTKRFYREVANWYFWALKAPGVVLPRSIEAMHSTEERDKQRSIFFIRLLTRLIFCWFLQEKGLLPRNLFRYRVAEELLKDPSPTAGTYYKAFLQNLFFATLNQEQELRRWRRKYQGSRDGNRGITTLWRYQDLLKSPDRLEALLRDRIPFVNGGLFDCLDDTLKEPDVSFDGFSERKDNHLCLPNKLFFGEEPGVDLSDVYEDARHKKEKVSGLIDILSRYKFTVEEKTPLEEEVALDPELLGEVFQNLLASYNEETRTTARRALGGFYTPREIVSYMVDDALRNYLTTRVPSVPEATLRTLFMPDAEIPPGLSSSQKASMVKAIGSVRILDPACGSGAFLMGALHRLVDLLNKLDRNNESWKRDRLAEAERYYELLRRANAPQTELAEVEARIEDIRRSFDTHFHELDFARKLYLIENCIYGVDIQPLACQIAKLRFFIALIVDQRIDSNAPNLGVRPLPNLETKIVAADSLVGIQQSRQGSLRSREVEEKEAELRRVRERHFLTRTPETKAKCHQQDAGLRTEIAALLRNEGWDASTARTLASWNPYDQNKAATFFDSEWMFNLSIGKVPIDDVSTTTMLGRLSLLNEAGGQMEMLDRGEIESGFDIVIGNPPYVRIQTLKRQNPKLVEYYKQHYESAKKGNYDLYVVFVEAGLNFLKPDGHLAYILPHKFFNAKYGEPLRDLLAKGRHLSHVVHFGDQQVFPGATNYVCLLFLAKAGVDSCRFVRVDDLVNWYETFKGTERQFPAEAISATEWNFAVGKGSNIFDRLNAMPERLGDRARIFQGLVTGADRTFVFNDLGMSDAGLVRVRDHSGVEWELETSQLKRFLVDTSLSPFSEPTGRHWLIFPYTIDGPEAKLLSARHFATAFPKTWAYLCEQSGVLKAREGGKWDHDQWYSFGRNQNLTQMEAPKLIVQVLSQSPRFAFDESGLYFTGGGNGPYYGVRWLPTYEKHSLRFLQALLNSKVSDYFIRNVSTTFRGGYWSYGKRFIEQIPIASATQKQKSLIEQLVEYLLWLNRNFRNKSNEKVPRDVLMLGYLEQVLNGLIYELYFPEELHANGLRLFDLVQQASLPALDAIPETQRLSRLRKEFECVYDLQHPLRAALHDLQTVEEVRVIEGKA
jgi:adenine-specific DNA-methyltransferase